MNTYKGTGVAIVTPFQLDDTVDYSSLSLLIKHAIAGGLDYIVTLGTTGETVTLTADEKKKIVQFTLSEVNGQIPVMVGCGGNNTQAVINAMKEMETWGDFDCFLSVSPYYNKPSQQGIYKHYQALSEHTDKNIMLYNVPGRTSRNIEVETTLRLGQDFSNIIGIKEAGNNIMQSIELARSKPDNFTLVSGDDDLLLSQMAHGFDGVISVVANAFPRHWSNVVRWMKEDKVEAARDTFHFLFHFVELIFTENNPAGIKAALNEMGLCANTFRLPVCPVSDSLGQKIRAEVKHIQKEFKS